MIPREVQPLVDALLPEIRSALGDNFTGAYLGGSIALGSFDPGTSDVDLLIVTERLLTDGELEALRAVHERIPPSENTFGQEYEAYYIDRETMRRFGPGQLQAKVEPDHALYVEPHRPNWVLERWLVRKNGVVVAGPDPETLIDPVSPQEMRQAAGGELAARLEGWTSGTWPRADLLWRGSQAFEVETVCRAMFTAATGQICSKREAVAWALTELPARWRLLIEWSQTCRRDRTIDDLRVEEVLAFLEWAMGEVS